MPPSPTPTTPPTATASPESTAHALPDRNLDGDVDDLNRDVNCNPNAYRYRVRHSESDRYPHRIVHPHAERRLYTLAPKPSPHAVAIAAPTPATPTAQRQPEPNRFTVADVTAQSHPHRAAVGHAVPHGNPDFVIHRDGDGHAAPYGNYHRHPYGLADGIRDGQSVSFTHALRNAVTRATAKCHGDATLTATRLASTYAFPVGNCHRHDNRRGHAGAHRHAHGTAGLDADRPFGRHGDGVRVANGFETTPTPSVTDIIHGNRRRNPDGHAWILRWGTATRTAA